MKSPPPPQTVADPPRDLAATLRPLVDKHQLPGVVGAILRGDRIVALGSVGVRKAGDPALFLATDLIHLGSDTKAMTASLIGRLIDQNQIAFDSTMRDVFPELAATMHREMAGVTVRQLLCHNAGLPRHLNWQELNAAGGSLMVQRRKAVEQALSAAPLLPIGPYAYSNVGYVLLGAIIEAKMGASWEDVIQGEIFSPLKMTSAGFGPPSMNGMIDQPWGHMLENGRLVPVQIDNPPVLGPAGTVHCSISDWSKFIAEILRSAQGNPTLLSQRTFIELTTPMPDQNYAGGWIIVPRGWADGMALTHAGSNTTWYCVAWIAPKRNFAVMICTNYGSQAVSDMVQRGVQLLIDFNSRI